MSRLRNSIVMGLSLLLSLQVTACDDSGVSGVAEDETTLSLYLTDAPGDVAAVWVDVSEIYFQGGPGGRLDLVTEPTGLIELTELVGTTRSLASELEVAPGIYSQLRFVLAAAVLEATNGEVYTFGGADHPDGLETTGELKCPGCSNSGLKVKLANDRLELEDGDNAVVLDFDVSQSFGRVAGNSGKWLMRPVIHAIRTDDGGDSDNPSMGSAVRGAIALAADAEGTSIALPQCPAGQDRTIGDFIPTATATTLTDGEGTVIVRTGSVKDDQTFEIGSLEPDAYTMGYESELVFDAVKLVWSATVDPTEIAVVAGEDVSGVAYTILGASCEPIGG